MIIQILHCPHCHGTDIVRHGQTRQGKQRYRCREKRCAGRTFLLDYTYPGQSPEVKRQIVDMAMNASGIRDTARNGAILPDFQATELSVGYRYTTNQGRVRTRLVIIANHTPWRFSGWDAVMTTPTILGGRQRTGAGSAHRRR